MALEVEDINAKLQKEDAELLLAKLKSELKGRTELPASWGGFTSPGIAQIEDALAAPSSSSSSSQDGGSQAAAVEAAAAEAAGPEDAASGSNGSNGAV